MHTCWIWWQHGAHSGEWSVQVLVYAYASHCSFLHSFLLTACARGRQGITKRTSSGAQTLTPTTMEAAAAAAAEAAERENVILSEKVTSERLRREDIEYQKGLNGEPILLGKGAFGEVGAPFRVGFRGEHYPTLPVSPMLSPASVQGSGWAAHHATEGPPRMAR